MQKMNFLTSILCLWMGVSFHAVADQPVVGKKAAQKYFQADSEREAVNSPSSRSSSGDNILMLHIGQYTDSQAYNWGPSNNISGAGQANYGLTYLFDEWHGTDVNFRADFSEYQLAGNRAVKLSLEPMLTFPRASSRFPLYFGVGGGPGIFLQQLNNKSSLSLDYELVMGLRFIEIAKSVGVFLEFGMKNHLFVLSEGQFNGTALDAGVVFNF